MVTSNDQISKRSKHSRVILGRNWKGLQSRRDEAYQWNNSGSLMVVGAISPATGVPVYLSCCNYPHNLFELYIPFLHIGEYMQIDSGNWAADSWFLDFLFYCFKSWWKDPSTCYIVINYNKKPANIGQLIIYIDFFIIVNPKQLDITIIEATKAA